MKLAICILSRGACHLNFSMNLFTQFIPSLQEDGVEVIILPVFPGGDIVRGRNIAAEKAAMCGADLALFLDDDIYPDKLSWDVALNSIQRGVDVCALDYVQRGESFKGVATRLQLYEEEPPLQVSGGGFILAKIDAIQRVLMEKGEFSFARRVGNHYLADDYSIFYLLHECKIPYEIHHRRVRHNPI